MSCNNNNNNIGSNNSDGLIDRRSEKEKFVAPVSSGARAAHVHDARRRCDAQVAQVGHLALVKVKPRDRRKASAQQTD